VFNLLRAIRELPPFSALTGEEELLLEDLIVQWHEHGVLKMSDLIGNAHFGPRSTVQRQPAEKGSPRKRKNGEGLQHHPKVSGRQLSVLPRERLRKGVPNSNGDRTLAVINLPVQE